MRFTPTGWTTPVAAYGEPVPSRRPIATIVVPLDDLADDAHILSELARTLDDLAEPLWPQARLQAPLSINPQSIPPRKCTARPDLVTLTRAQAGGVRLCDSPARSTFLAELEPDRAGRIPRRPSAATRCIIHGPRSQSATRSPVRPAGRSQCATAGYPIRSQGVRRCSWITVT